MRGTVERVLEGALELVIPTPIGRVRLRTDWEALAHAMERRMPWGVCPDRDVRLDVVRGEAYTHADSAPEACPRAMLVEDAVFEVSPDSIVGMVPEPCRCEGMVLDWLLLALACFCAPPGWEALHTAAAERDGEAVLVFGGSGAGKTRALEALCEAGWACVADDTVLAEAGTGRIVGWQANIHLRPADVRRLAPGALGQTLDQGGKVRLSPTELGWHVSAGGSVSRIIALSMPENMPDPFHTHVELGTEWIRHAPHLLEGAEFWGRRPADLAEKVAALGAWAPASGELAICTPFAGKAALDSWLAAFDAAGFPEGTHILWLANTRDGGFASRLRGAAHERSGRYQLTVWTDTHRVGLKDQQVAYLWQQIRTRLPESVRQVLTLEDDVLMPEGGWREFARGRQRCGGILGAAVAHSYSGVPSWLAWRHNVEGRGNQIAPDLWAEPVLEAVGDSEVGAVSFSCTLIPRDAIDAATLAPAEPHYLAGGYDHRFCRESGEQVRVLWGLRCAHLRIEKGAVVVLRTPADVLVVLGPGDAPRMGVGWEVRRHGVGDLGEALRGAVGAADWAVVLDGNATVPAAYVEECIEALRWHPNHALAWGKRMGADGRLYPPAAAAALIRLDACRGIPDGRFDACRAWLCREGWKELWLDSCAWTDLQAGSRESCAQIIDLRRDGAPYQVVTVNRSEHAGDLPGFGGDVVQLEGYRSGLWALGIPCDRRDALPHMDFSGYRVIHLYHVHLSWSATVAEQARDVPLVVSAITHGRPQREECEAAILRATHVLCYSRAEAEFYADLFPECRAKLRVVPMGVRPELYTRERSCQAERRVFMAGRYCEYKNQLTCLRACARLGTPVTFAGFADMGSEPWAYRDRLLEEAKRLDADCEVLPRLSGEDLWQQYDRAWVHVNCSQFEPFGQVTLDALALGCNVVHTRESWAAEEFGRVGSLCDPGEVESVAAAVRAELNRPRGWADSRPPTWVRAASSLLPIYEEAMGG